MRALRNVRARLLTIVLVALVAALGVTTYGFNVLFAHTTSRNADSLLRARASSELGLLTLEQGRLTATETSDDAIGDTTVWIYGARGRPIERPRTRSSADGAAASLAGGSRRFLEVPASDLRLYAVPVVLGGRRVGTLVTGLSLAPYEQTEATALEGSLALVAVLLLVVGAAVYWLLRSALRPVARMTEQAAAWSERDLDRRFDLGPPHDELTQLAATLDGLLDRLAASLRHERRFSAELSHELRTPLAKVIAGAELALRRDREPEEYRAALEGSLRNARQVARIVETLVAAAQQEAGAARGTADAYAVAVGAAGELAGLAAERRVELTTERPAAAVRLGVDADLAERILQPVLENACRYGRSHVRVGIARRGARVLYAIEDDGPGVEPAERESIFEPGVRGSAASGDGLGAGLGLSLARRLARTATGEITVEANGSGGRFVVSLPAA